MKEMLNDMKDILVAVGSTVIGTIVGWILGKINFGKVHISITNYTEEYLYVEPGYMSIPGKTDNELYEAKLSFKICLYNSSSINKAIRNCTLKFFDCAHHLLFEKSVFDEDSRNGTQHRIVYDKVEIANIPAYESMNINAFVKVHDIDHLYQVKKIRFQYEDARFHKHYLKYKDIDFSIIPHFNIVEKEGK